MAISREQIVEQSVKEFVREQLFDVRGLSEDKVEIIDSPPERKADAIETPLTKNYAALGFHFDEGGEQAELGSDLKRRVYVIEFIVFGMTSTWAANLANTIRDAAEVDNGRIPLLDLATAGHPVLDYMTDAAAIARRQPVPDPHPWEEYVWITTVQVSDEYYSRLV
jgi:hypothetical protein